MLRLTDVAKRYANGYLALSGISLGVGRGDILALVGGSGCGKSTLLRLVSGLDQPTGGLVELDGSPVTGPRPDIAVVFQEPRLMPWLKIADNVAFGLTGVRRAEKYQLVADALERVGLTRFATALPRQLSGGMAQRVALARALVTRPKVLLLDEPFSALDALTRADLQDHLVDVWSGYPPEERPTLVLVTHDIDEALVLADRVVVLAGNPGRVHVEEAVILSRQGRRDDERLPALRTRLLEALRAAQRAGQDARRRNPGRRPRQASASSRPEAACQKQPLTHGRRTMKADELRGLQAPLKQRYKDQPDAAVVTLKAQGTLDSDKLVCKVETGRALVEAGLHPATGGPGSFACSGDMLLEALVACAGVTLKAVATALELRVTGGSVRAEGDLDFRGTLGVAKDAPVGFRDIRLTFDLEGDLSEEQKATLAKLTERYCVVYQTLRQPPPVDVAFNVAPPTALA
ncbi:ATP-binding cassette domain-containing protein [Aerophototrophica crusticola]